MLYRVYLLFEIIQTVSLVNQQTSKQAIEFPPRNIIPTPKVVTGETSDDSTELELYEEISNSLRKIRNRSLKIDVLMNDLLDCQTQGFDVSAAFDPLKCQKDDLAFFEKDVFTRLKAIVNIIDEKSKCFK